MNKILVTGAAGFIGYHTVKALLAKGFDVVGIDNIDPYYDVNLKYARLRNLNVNCDQDVFKSDDSNFSFHKVSIEDKVAVGEIFKTHNFDYVCHLAAQAGVRYSIDHPHKYITSNIEGFLNILEGCRNNSIKHLVYASSSSVYGYNRKIPFATSDPVDHPISLYAATKKSNELMAHTYSHLFAIPVTGLRFFTVYGPWGRPDMSYYLFTKAIINGEPIKIFNEGNMLRDFTYIDDIVNGIINVIPLIPHSSGNYDQELSPASSFAAYKIYNIGNNNPVKLLDFISTLEDLLDKKAIKEYLPMQPGDVEVTYANIDPLIHDLNYKPETQVREGLQKFVNWYKEYYK